jgi:hypothetical protein
MCPARGILRAVGYEFAPGDQMARAATKPAMLVGDMAPAGMPA